MQYLMATNDREKDILYIEIPLFAREGSFVPPPFSGDLQAVPPAPTHLVTIVHFPPISREATRVKVAFRLFFLFSKRLIVSLAIKCWMSFSVSRPDIIMIYPGIFRIPLCLPSRISWGCDGGFPPRAIKAGRGGQTRPGGDALNY